MILGRGLLLGRGEHPQGRGSAIKDLWFQGGTPHKEQNGHYVFCRTESAIPSLPTPQTRSPPWVYTSLKLLQ